ncbi:MAG: hypothetical protein ACFCBU_18205 [Cyanophyceae cyanobacterium]
MAIAALPKITDQLRRVQNPIIPTYPTVKFSAMTVDRTIAVLSHLARHAEEQTGGDLLSRSPRH